jgi:hypothetical protein
MALRHAEAAFDLARDRQGQTSPIMFLPTTIRYVSCLRGYSLINEKNRPVEDWPIVCK